MQMDSAPPSRVCEVLAEQGRCGNRPSVADGADLKGASGGRPRLRLGARMRRADSTVEKVCPASDISPPIKESEEGFV